MKFPGLSGIFFLLLLLTGFTAHAQLEANHWYFGNRAGLLFSGNNPPTILTNSKMRALEGCTAISDSLGNLLFYTAGDTVYNKLHQRMNNGWLLAGDQSASQSAVIVPNPFQANMYYLFTVDELGNNTNGLRYSIINTAANNGMGSVIAKNVPLLSPVAEKITVVDDRYSLGSWIIVHGTGAANDAFYAYRLTAAGLSAPVISRVGMSQAGPYPNFNATGYMKASPDGQSLAVALADRDLVELYKFNDSSGVVSAPVTLRGLDKAYGVEFNREGTRLYVSVQRLTFHVDQFRLDIPRRDSIQYTQRVVGIGQADFAGALQLAPNGKIYHADVFKHRISLINHPDSTAGAVRFTSSTQYLNPLNQTLRFSHQGLPNFNQSYFWLPSFKFRKQCFGDTTAFNLLTTRKFKSLLWNFNDSASGAQNFSSQTNPYHIFSAPGKYQVTLTVTLLNDKVRSVTMPITIEPAPTLDLGPERIICPNTKMQLAGPEGFSKYRWSTGSDSAATLISRPGLYWLRVQNKTGCWVYDTVKVVPMQGPEIFKEKFLEVCPGRPVKLRTSQPFASYNWGLDRRDSTLTVNRAGHYTVSVPFNGCIFTDTIQVGYRACPEDLMIPNMITPNGDYHNETFFVRGILPGKLELQLFNRWGTRILHDKAYKYDWPKPGQPDGTYFYLLHNPETGQTWKGWIEVVH